ncbi:MAG: homoserine kinase [Clostridia bacterium]|nr:homoserine kinase [Clostridia bacterium]
MIIIFKVKIPATTTNLGPGFDCLGMSVELFNFITVEKSDTLEIVIPDDEKGIIPTDDTNLIVQAMKKSYDYLGVAFIPVKITQENNIPFARGLGSSAACIVGGILAANKLSGEKLDFEEMLSLAVSMDGHPDNVLPAFLGGMTAASMDENKKVTYVKLMPHDKFQFVFIIPNFHLKTSDARKVLPNEYSFHDAVHSSGNAVVLTASLVNGLEGNLKAACEDYLHQPYRKSLIPNYDLVKNKAYALGAHAFYLSGAGPTMCCIVTGDAQLFIKSMSEYLEGIGEYKLFSSPASSKGAEIF